MKSTHPREASLVFVFVVEVGSPWVAQSLASLGRGAQQKNEQCPITKLWEFTSFLLSVHWGKARNFGWAQGTKKTRDRAKQASPMSPVWGALTFPKTTQTISHQTNKPMPHS